MSDHLSLPLRLPDTHHDAYGRLDEFVQHVATRVLHNRWTPEHLNGISASNHQAWKYFDEHQPFEEIDDQALYHSIHDEEPSENFELYVPSRIRRCILQKVGETLGSHADRRRAFQAIQHVLPTHKINRIHRRHIKEKLWDDGEYLSSGYVDVLIDQLNSYYDRHGRYPDSYFELQDPPEYSNGALPYSADDGPSSGQAVKYHYDEDEQSVTVNVKTPDTVTPESRGEWSWHEHELTGYDAFQTLILHGSLSAPEFQSTQRKNGDWIYELSFPVDVDVINADGDAERVLALDAGMRKDMTAVVIDETGKQVSRPHFIRFTDRDGMGRLHRERQRLNNRLAGLRRSGRDYSEEFTTIQAEYERVNNKIQHKREQLVHDVANQVAALALVYDVDAVVHEDLRSLSPPRGEGELSWKLSSWARHEIVEKIEYRCEYVGVEVERVYPHGTSRSCPRCGSTGHTCKSPDHSEEVWWGGHFRCDNARCKFEGDRDYVAAVNVARVFFGGTDELESGFTSSYTGDSETVPARRSVGTRLAFGRGVVAYRPGQARATAGGGSAVIAPAVALSESNMDGSDGCGPATRQYTQFQRVTAEHC